LVPHSQREKILGGGGGQTPKNTNKFLNGKGLPGGFLDPPNKNKNLFWAGVFWWGRRGESTTGKEEKAAKTHKINKT